MAMKQKSSKKNGIFISLTLMDYSTGGGVCQIINLGYLGIKLDNFDFAFSDIIILISNPFNNYFNKTKNLET